MMKKRYFVLVTALVCCIMSTLAQDVTVLHMKDGTTRRYTNGVMNTTNMTFYEYNRHQITAPQTEISSNGHIFPLDVNQYWKIKDQYVVGNYWQDDIPVNFQAIRGVCFGKTPGLTVDNCLGKTYIQPYSDGSNLYYVVIGEPSPLGLEFSDASIIIRDSAVNRIVVPLEMGVNYYYRLFSECQVQEGGQQKTAVFYGEEKNFRIPRLMAAYDYYPTPKATPEALAAFAAHFPADVTPPTWEQLDTLWNVWRATDQGKSIDLSADISSAAFDDGTGYRLNHIPDEFYNWLAHREIVIDPYYGLFECINCAGDWVQVIFPDASWNVPGGKYVLATPISSTVNPQIKYRSAEVIPGVSYKIQVIFAPETQSDNTTPSKVNVDLDQMGSTTSSNRIFQGEEVSAEVTTTLEADGVTTTSMGMDITIQSRVSSKERRQNQFNPVLRVAGIRLIPIGN